MKLLYIYDTMPKAYQAYMYLLLNELKKQIPIKTLAYQNHKEADFCIKSHQGKDKLQRFAFKHKLSKIPSEDIKIIKQFDVIHLQHSYLFKKLNVFYVQDIEKKPKIVITLRGSDTYIRTWLNDSWQNFYKNQSQFIDAFITVSEHQKKYLQKWGVPKEKIHVIPVSFGKNTHAKPKYPSTDKIKIVSAHRMCWEKNIEGNIRVAKLLKEKGYHVCYDIYGDGPDRGQVPFLIDKYDLKNEVSYKGKIENNEFKKRLPNYDFFLQLSHSEAFGASVIEAQAMGLPAIISNSGGLPETILNNKTGFYCDAYNSTAAAQAIETLFLDTKKYLEFSKKAIEYVNTHFTISHEIDKLINLYNSFDSK